ncbi:MAG TPA: GGDEF domain-containing protein [Polyangiaceae bacterium]|jgi:diguanylate cyclase (GGDEF)-like protein
MTRDELKFRAALSRFAVGVVALALLPTFYPGTRPHLWIWVAYLGIAAVEQVLIRKRIGGSWRAFVSGLIDITVLTYTVHGLGSTVTPMASLYMFAGVANALVVRVRVAYALTLLGPLAYDAVVWAEWAGWLPFAPDVPKLAAMGPPSLEQTLMASLFVTVFVPASTAIVAALVKAVQRREDLLVAANARLEELSQLDPLTNLYNRRHLFARIEVELARVRRGHPLALVMIDLDGFKRVNDAEGHLRGDVLLKEIATELASTTRASDVAGRYGGDEFVVVLPDTDGEKAHAAGERVAQSVRDAAKRFDTKLKVTASVGIAVAEPADTVAALLRRADQKAYRAKQDGGDRVVA